MTPPEQPGATSARFRIEGLDAVPGPDQAGITATIGALFAGFQQRDAGLFADQNFNDGRLAAPPASVLRPVTESVVIISTHLQVTGQGLVGGGVIGLRDNHSLHILQKQPSGQWQIISEMFSDARQDLSYINHS